MKTLFIVITLAVFWLACTAATTAQTNETATGAVNSPVLKKTFSETPFLGTKNVLTVSGDYVTTPKEDYPT